jgi:hypothetical protein
MNSALREIAAARRQMILDFLHANPGAKMGVIGTHLFGEKESRSRHHNTIHTMLDWGEVRMEGPARSRKYWALASITRSAVDVHTACMHNADQLNSERRADKVRRAMRSNAGLYVHTPSKHPITNQGGQGALRRTIFVNCNQNY